MNLDDRLIKFNSSCAESARKLLESQKQTWEQCRNGYASLNTIRVKTFEFDNYIIKVQFNPGRLTSSSAKVDPQSIKERKCFLCMNNLPPEQKGILYKKHYVILCNPFPIFPEHFTIPAIEHKPQAILGSFNDLLSLSRDLSENYIVFYNGPKCGASAPDHLHFQAGNKNFMPLVSEYLQLKKKYASIIFSDDNVEINFFNDSVRKLIIIESPLPEKIESSFLLLYDELVKISPQDEEPLMNIISVYDDNKWKVIIILREKHRPSRFFEEGENNILLSPASVDLGGVCITPLEKDFNKITKEDIIEIFNEVILKDDKFQFLIKNLKLSFN